MLKKVTDETIQKMWYLRGIGHSYESIAKNLCLGKSTVYRWLTPEKKLKRIKYKKIYSKKYRKKNKEYLLLQNKKWRNKNQTYIKIKHKEWRENNNERWKEICREAMRRYSYKNPDRIREINKKYRQTPKGIVYNLRHINTRRNKFPIKLSVKDFDFIKQRDKVCIYCGSSKDITLDHVYPNGATDLTNLVLSCRSCNSKKRTKNVFSFCREIGIEVPKIISQLKQNSSTP